MSHKAKILLVDDEIDLLHGLKKNLRLLGFKVLTATSGGEAFELFMVHNFDLVITDMRMPNGDGLELLNNLRKIDSSIPVICFITECSDQQIQEVEKLGVVAMLSKPFELQELLNAINKGLNKKAI